MVGVNSADNLIEVREFDTISRDVASIDGIAFTIWRDETLALLDIDPGRGVGADHSNATGATGATTRYR